MSQSESNNSPLGMRIGESVFCIGYLVFALIAGIVMLSRYDGNQYILYAGIMVLVLCFGDSFHLVPRIIRNVRGPSSRSSFYLGLGNLVSSITMTLFYVLMFYVVCYMNGMHDVGTADYAVMVLLDILAVVRIGLCLVPSNRWFDGVGDQRWALLRNVPFTAMGIVTVVYLVRFYLSGVDMANGEGLFFSFLPYSRFLMMAILVVVSFLCYLPVVLAGKKKPKLGMLMIPKTICYIWLICLFFDLT